MSAEFHEGKRKLADSSRVNYGLFETAFTETSLFHDLTNLEHRSSHLRKFLSSEICVGESLENSKREGTRDFFLYLLAFYIGIDLGVLRRP